VKKKTTIFFTNHCLVS